MIPRFSLRIGFSSLSTTFLFKVVNSLIMFACEDLELFWEGFWEEVVCWFLVVVWLFSWQEIKTLETKVIVLTDRKRSFY